MLRRVLAGTISASSFTGVAILMFHIWSAEATGKMNTPQPMGLTCLLCILTTCILGLLQRKRFAEILVIGLGGLLVGFFLFPSTSMRPSTRNHAVLSGGIQLFIPYAVCLGACLGTIVGQNLVEIRRLIARLNTLSPHLRSEKANEEKSKEQPSKDAPR